MNAPIWLQPLNTTQLNARGQNTIVAHLGIKITEVGPDYIRGTMPVDERTFQPTGRVHGGANVVLAETLGSMGANMLVDSAHYCVGQEVNANHVRGVTSGMVTGTARLAYRGRRSQVWEIAISDENHKLTCISRLTIAVIKR